MTRHDGDLERTFAALPPARGQGFAQTWWGQAWLKALEETALDSAQLKAGRRLARAGAVGAVSVRPGRITAVVQGRDRTAYRADVLLEELSAQQWDRFLDMTVERAGHVAALLDREMPPHLVEDAAATGIELLPGMGDLEPECGCDAWDHCGHTAALCYQVGRLLDQDPFVLLLMRGRGERDLLNAVQARSAASADAPSEPSASEPEGVDAAEAYATGDILPPLPALPELPAEPGVPPSLDTETPPAHGVDPAALEFLAARTAAEAHRMLADALRGDPEPEQLAAVSELTAAQDAVRLAAGDPLARVAERLADGTGRGREGLAVAARAWHLGGVAALSVLDEEWTVEAEALARARAALESAWDEEERPSLRAKGNRWTVVGAPSQLRLGRDGRWWPYRKERGQWVPAGGPAQDPAAALASAQHAAEEDQA
ncbi:SWF or SNF family helicase [Streptomyces sp. ISL-22]|uniref:SWIM zinc finger family protein n=1 Tax=unclassified Streptomyces TaxID=2593676 RepID=UPI001BE7CDAF|nr:MULTISPECIES: SWF or SNF family helicase [unclassified Streptomyces]MBT2420408.1 SWF or SNF family helicase [Streptomyces sp. ISL-24]MBT2438514.1 SWF or SNF family helicase [Streptomyces sp. ISL-22]